LPVLMDGDFNSEIAIVGDAPGIRESSTGRPFMGGSGNYLWECLREIGIDRRQCYITNAIKRKVVTSKAKSDMGKMVRTEQHKWNELLQWELNQLPNLKYVLVLGNYALEAVTGDFGIMNWRGTSKRILINNTPPKHVSTLCAYNPAMIIRDTRLSPVFRFDILKFKRVINNSLKPTNVIAHINPTFDQAMAWIHKMDSYLPIGLDIETIGEQTACVGLANTIDEGMCINFRTIDKTHYTLEEEIEIRMAICALLANPKNKFTRIKAIGILFRKSSENI